MCNPIREMNPAAICIHFMNRNFSIEIMRIQRIIIESDKKIQLHLCMAEVLYE